MDPKSPPTETSSNILSLLNAAVEAMNLTKEVSSATPAEAVFASVSIILVMIRVRVSSSPIIY